MQKHPLFSYTHEAAESCRQESVPLLNTENMQAFQGLILHQETLGIPTFLGKAKAISALFVYPYYLI